MTLILRANTLINNPNAPKLIKYDPIESRTGSLYLWDAGLQKYSSLPPINDTLPNLLDPYAAATGNAFTIVKVGSATTDTYCKRELTAQGALHFMVSQTFESAISSEAYFGVVSNSALRQVLYNKIMTASQNLYFSMWTRVTRVGKNTTNRYGPMVSYANGNTSDYALYLQSKQINPSVGATSTSTSKLGVPAYNTAALAPNFYQANIKDYAGTGVTPTTPLKIGSGVMTPWNATQAQNESPSFAVYRIYIEDLSVSGRTFDQVKAIDDAEFAKAFGVGGRFYGDTWSDPATVLP